MKTTYDMRAALTAVMPHAAKSDLSVFELFHFRVEGDIMKVAATDRYTMASVDVPVTESEPVEFGLPVASAKALVKVLPKRYVPELTFTVIGEELRVTAGDELIGAYRVALIEDYPFPWSLLERCVKKALETGEPETSGLVTLNMAYLGKFKDAAKAYGNAALNLRITEGNGPVGVTLRGVDEFRAVIMPIANRE